MDSENAAARDPSRPFTLRNSIHFTHTDPAGFVFFPRYFEMLQAVTEEWFTQQLRFKFADLVMEQRIGQPTAHTECEFIKPCRLGEHLDIALFLESLGRSALTICYVGSVEGDIRFRARSIQVMVSMDSGHVVPIEGELRSAMEAYRDQVALPDDVGPKSRRR